MIMPDPETLACILTDQIRTLAEAGALAHLEPDPDFGYTCEAVFGFHPSEVWCIHTHKVDVGDGLWFRLKDHRVIDVYGEETDSDHDLYDTMEN